MTAIRQDEHLSDEAREALIAVYEFMVFGLFDEIEVELPIDALNGVIGLLTQARADAAALTA